MHRNENKSDQLFRDRLKDHSHPVRADLWSRIYSGLKSRMAVRPSRYDLIKAALRNWHFSTMTLTAGAAGMLAVTLGIIYFTHTTKPPITQPVTPSTAKAADEAITTREAAAATSTRFDSVTRTTAGAGADPVSNVPVKATTQSEAPGTATTKSEAPATTTTKPKTPSEATTSATRTPITAATSTTATSTTATNAPRSTSATSATATNSTSPTSTSATPTTQTSTASASTAIATTKNTNATGTVTHRNRRSANNLNTSANLTQRAGSTNLADRDASANPTLKSTNPTHGDASANATHPAIYRHTPTHLTLPATASTSTRAAITARPPVAQSRLATHLGPGGSTGAKSKNLANATAFKRGVYVSLYASPDFPNHYYTWSYTVGFRASLQFSPRWSFTAGLEYARVNVPTQVVPPIGYGDTLHSFYFSNYEVPILFGYKSTFGRSELTINGGAILNLYFHQSTGVWTFNWPDRASYGAVLGVDYSYSLNRRLALFGQPYGRYSVSNNRSFIPAQRLSFGTLLGIRYRLF